MKTPRWLLFVASLLALAACASTDEPTPSTDDSPHVEPAAVESSAVESGATTDGPAEDWIAERWPELASVEVLIEKQDFDTACGVLAAWMEPGLEERCSGMEVQRRLEVTQRIDSIAERLSMLDAQLEALEMRHQLLEDLLAAEHPSLLAVKQNLAATRQALGDLAGALVLAEHVHAASERVLPADHPDLLIAKLNLATTHYELGDVAEAHALFEHVHAAWERLLPEDHPYLLAAKQNLALTRRSLGDLEGARVLEQHVHAARERLLPADHPALLMAKQNLAVTHRELGDLEVAHALFEHVLAARERLLPADHPDLLNAKQNLAVTRKELGDLVGARTLEEHVCAAWERLLPADHHNLLSAKLNFALSCSALGDHDLALEILEQVHAARELLLSADHPDLLLTKESLAASRYDVGDVGGALTLFEDVHAAREKLLPTGHPDLLVAKMNLAVLHNARGELVEAQALEENVIAAWERLLPSDHPNLLDGKERLAWTCAERGDLVGLRAVVASLFAAQVALCESASSRAQRAARSAALRELERLEWQAFWCDSLRSNDGVGLDSAFVGVLESLRLISTASAERARVAAALPEYEHVRSALSRVRRELADASQSAPVLEDAMESWRAKLVELSEERDRLEREVRRQLHELGLGFEMPTARSIAEGIEEGGAHVGFWRYDRYGDTPTESGVHESTDSLLAVVVRRDGSVSRVELGATEPLERLVERWRSALDARLERGLGTVSGQELESVAGRALRAALLDPILAALGGEAPRVLHVVPDDLVHLVPLDALPNEDGTRVGESLVIRVDPSVARLTLPARAVEPRGTLVALGGVDYGASDVPDVDYAVAVATARGGSTSFEPLLQSRYEVEAVGSLFEEHVGGEPRVLRGAEASEAALVESAPSARYLHLATHGWFTPASEAVSKADRVERSDGLALAQSRAQDTIVGFLPETLCGLALAGANHGVKGKLTAEELATLDLTNCELAVLSACETNVGIRRAGQGIQSLQTALHAAGARTAITSLWKVDDAATRRLFELFYTKLWSEQLGPADALWQAKMALRAEGHPTRDWAGWVLTGDPD